MLKNGMENPDPIRERSIAITPKTSAPNPGEDIPNIIAKIPSINKREVRIGFERNFIKEIPIDGE